MNSHLKNFVIMNTKIKSRSEEVTTVATRIAGEDISKGDYVSVLTEIAELPSYHWNYSEVGVSPNELVRFQYIPCDAGQPYKVVAVCLPFVYTKRPSGNMVTLDTRQIQMVRLDRDSCRVVWKRMRKALKKKRKK